MARSEGLNEADSMDASELADRASILAPSLSRILKNLESRGYITLRKDPGDGRRSLVSVSEAGSTFLADVAPESAEIYKEIEALVGTERIEILLDEIENADRPAFPGGSDQHFGELSGRASEQPPELPVEIGNVI